MYRHCDNEARDERAHHSKQTYHYGARCHSDTDLQHTAIAIKIADETPMRRTHAWTGRNNRNKPANTQPRFSVL